MRAKGGNVRLRPPDAGPGSGRSRWESARAAGLASLGFAIPLFLVALIVAAIAIAVALTRNSCYCVEIPYPVHPGPTRPAPPFSPANAATRLRDARAVLSGVILPPGSVTVTPPPELRPKPASLYGGPPATDAGGRAWRVPLPVSEARAFFNTRPPRGTSPEASNPAAERMASRRTRVR